MEKKKAALLSMPLESLHFPGEDLSHCLEDHGEARLYLLSPLSPSQIRFDLAVRAFEQVRVNLWAA